MDVIQESQCYIKTEENCIRMSFTFETKILYDHSGYMKELQKHLKSRCG